MHRSKIGLYEKIADLTKAICQEGKDECRSPFRCCKRKYCKIAERNIQKSGLEIQPFKKRIMFLGSNGCIVPPYLRPICALHVCTISCSQKSHIDHDPAKTKEYFDLRRLIEQ